MNEEVLDLYFNVQAACVRFVGWMVANFCGQVGHVFVVFMAALSVRTGVIGSALDCDADSSGNARRALSVSKEVLEAS